MIKVQKKIISSAFVGLAILGVVLKCSEVSAQVLGKAVVQEERGVSRKQISDSKIKKQIEDYILKNSSKYVIVKSYFEGSVRGIDVGSLDDFKRIENSLHVGNYLVHVGSVDIHLKVIR